MMFSVSHPGARAILSVGGASLFIDPKTTIKITGNNNENTTDVGLLSIASRLNFEIVNADLTERK
jgi:hypothetical protein